MTRNGKKQTSDLEGMLEIAWAVNGYTGDQQAGTPCDGAASSHSASDLQAGKCHQAFNEGEGNSPKKSTGRQPPGNSFLFPS